MSSIEFKIEKLRSWIDRLKNAGDEVAQSLGREIIPFLKELHEEESQRWAQMQRDSGPQGSYSG